MFSLRIFRSKNPYVQIFRHKILYIYRLISKYGLIFLHKNQYAYRFFQKSVHAWTTYVWEYLNLYSVGWLLIIITDYF